MPAAVQRLYVPDLQWKYPEGIIRVRPEIVRQSDLHSMGKMQSRRETGRPSAMRRVTTCAWPVIDATFRYSIFLLGSLVAHAPFYSGILQGLQVSDVTPYS
jgi:hypothetical protein